MLVPFILDYLFYHIICLQDAIPIHDLLKLHYICINTLIPSIHSYLLHYAILINFKNEWYQNRNCLSIMIQKNMLNNFYYWNLFHLILFKTGSKPNFLTYIECQVNIVVIATIMFFRHIFSFYHLLLHIHFLLFDLIIKI